jgi:hypothetical protein
MNAAGPMIVSREVFAECFVATLPQKATSRAAIRRRRFF